jgi:MFS family permease
MLTVREPIRGFHDAPGLGDQAAPPFTAVIKRMFVRPAFVHVVLGSTIASMGGFGINLFVAAYFTRRFGLDYAQAGLLSGLISAIPGSISMLGGGLLADWLGRRDARFYPWVPAVGSLLAAPLYIASFMQGSWVGVLVMLMITGVFQYAYLPISGGVTANLMEPRMRASAAAVVGIMTNLVGAGLAPFVVGRLSDHFTAHVAPACVGKAAAAVSCTAASAEGLRQACMVFAVVYLWAAVHFVLASRTIRRDLA